MPDALRTATALSAAIAVFGVWPQRRSIAWQAYWPVPIMVFAAGLVARDLAVLVGGGPSELPAFQLLLGIWAGLTVVVVGAVEMWASRRGGSAGGRLIAAAFLVASGVALLLYHASMLSPRDPAGIVSGLLILMAGGFLAAHRSMERPVPMLGLLWPAALLAGALLHPSAPYDELAEARRELGSMLAALRQEGSSVSLADTPSGTARFIRGPVQTFRVDGNEVQVYLLAHDDDSRPEAHRAPHIPVPPPIEGVPHLHRGPHIVVVCVTADPRFARKLDTIVHELGGRSSPTAFSLLVSVPV